MKQTFNIVFDTDERALKFREIISDFVPFSSYVGKHWDGAYAYELTTTTEESLELFYWLGKFNNRPTHFSLI